MRGNQGLVTSATRCTCWRVKGAAIVGLLFAIGTPVGAQNPVEQTDWVARSLRASGQPVIPAFEGWWQNTDGTYELCFGYFTANTEEALDIPLGPDNFIEPSEFDGFQPTHFDPVPFEHRRYFCVMTINVPESFGSGTQEVVWTLRVDGHTYSVPGYPRVNGYILNEPDAPDRAAAWDELLARAEPNDDVTNLGRGNAQGSTAPLLRFLDPPGPEGRGRTGIFAQPVSVTQGVPLPLSVSVREASDRPSQWWVGWFKHQGPGDVRFGPQDLVASPTRVITQASTTAIFTEPGSYFLRVQAIENINSFERHCCWTNGYLEVIVTP